MSKSGDLIRYDFMPPGGNGTPDHVGIIHSVIDGTINAVEGNTSLGTSRVMMR